MLLRPINPEIAAAMPATKAWGAVSAEGQRPTPPNWKLQHGSGKFVEVYQNLTLFRLDFKTHVACLTCQLVKGLKALVCFANQKDVVQVGHNLKCSELLLEVDKHIHGS